MFLEKKKQVITEIITTNRKQEKKNKQMKSMVLLTLRPKYKACGIFFFFSINTHRQVTDAA
jgi:hypothetical protein